MAKVANITTKLNLIVPGKKVSVKETEKRDFIIKIFVKVFSYLFLIVSAIIVIFPFFYMIMGSFMQEKDLSLGNIVPTMGNIFENIAYNYSETLSRFNYWRYVGNTLVVGLSTSCLSLLVTILSAFAFSRLKFTGREILFTCFLATMMIPGEMMVISNYITMSNFNLIGHNQTTFQAYTVMVLPFIASVFYIYLLRQNFLQIPNELYLAAKVDGKSDWSYLWKVMVPLASPTLITIFILNFIGSWNAYVWPKLVTNVQDNWIISVAVRGDTLSLLDPNGVYIPQSSWQLAATVLTVVPLLILFIIFRKYIMRGAGRAGIKG